MSYCIIGNSTAGIAAAEAIRMRDRERDITIISAEKHDTYSRPLISYMLLGKRTKETVGYRDADFYERNNITLIRGKRAVSVNADSHIVTLDDGELVPYGQLLVAAGSTPFVPPTKGLDDVSYHTFMSLDDALGLEAAIAEKPNAKVLIVGAGLIGLKCAEGIADKVHSITVIDLSPRILSSILDDDGAAFVRKRLESHGISFMLGTSVSEFLPGCAKVGDSYIDFDILVMAVGVRPNVGLVKDAGGKVNRGIVVDTLMRTSLPDIFAAGDCVESFDVSFGDNRVLALLPNAHMQGETAGLMMSGFEKPFVNAVPLNAIGFFDVHMATAGTYDGAVYERITNDGYKKLFYKDDVLKGFIIIGNVEKCGIYTSLIRERTPLSSIDFGLICEKPSLMAFSRESRIRKLATVSEGYGGIY